MELFMADDIIVEVAPEPQEIEQVEIEVKQDAMQDEGEEAPEEVTEEPAKPKDEPIPKGVQRRIDRAVRQKYEAEARANELERRIRQIESQAQPVTRQQQGSEGEPRLDQFEDIESYVSAKAAWVADQRINSTLTAREKAEAEARQQATQRTVAETWQKRIAQATAELPDYDDVVGSSDIVFTDAATIAAIQESDIGPQIAYYLASNPDEADEIAQLSGTAAIRAIGRLEAKIEGKTVSVTKAPPPIKPVGQKAKVTKSPTEMSADEFAAWRKRHIARR